MLRKPGYRGWVRVVKAARNSLQGLVAVWRSEEAFRQEVWLFLPLVALAVWLDVSVVERLLLIGSLVLVLLMELVNTALEYVVDRISTDLHPLSGSIKDVGSALVMVALGFALLVWGLILWPV